MEGMLSPEIKEEIVATIEVREVFRIGKVGTIAGCFVRDGKINRNTKSGSSVTASLSIPVTLDH